MLPWKPRSRTLETSSLGRISSEASLRRILQLQLTWLRASESEFHQGQALACTEPRGLDGMNLLWSLVEVANTRSYCHYCGNCRYYWNRHSYLLALSMRLVLATSCSCRPSWVSWSSTHSSPPQCKFAWGTRFNWSQVCLVESALIWAASC